MSKLLIIKWGVILAITMGLNLIFDKYFLDRIFENPKVKRAFKRNINNTIDLITIIIFAVCMVIAIILTNGITWIFSQLKTAFY